MLIIANIKERLNKKWLFGYIFFQSLYLAIVFHTYVGISSILVLMTVSITLFCIWWLPPQQMRVVGGLNCFTYLAYQISIKNWAGLLEIFVILSNFFSFLKYKKSDNWWKIAVSGNGKPDFAGCSPTKVKKHLERCFFKNGAISKIVPRRLKSPHDTSAASQTFARRCRLRTFRLLTQSLKSPLLLLLIRNNKKGHPFRCPFLLLVPLVRIGLTTPSLPMTCSTTELYRQKITPLQ